MFWNPKIDARAARLLEEIDKTDADVIGLQEVPPVFYEEISRKCKYEYSRYYPM